MVERCARWPACTEHRDLADFLGHDYQGHVSLNTLVHDGVTTVDGLCTACLPDVPNLGPVRIARIRQRLDARPRGGDGS